MIKRTFLIFEILVISLFFIACTEKKDKADPLKKTQEVVLPETKISYGSILASLQPDLITEEEFDNFKKKSHYIQVIEAYDTKNISELLGGKKNKAHIRYYGLPTEINTEAYSSNSILFGDLNEDGKRDCIIIAYRSDGYNEMAFFYVFINFGNSFKLSAVQSEDEVCGCKRNGWPSLFGYQKIEDGYLKGISKCHYMDAHCCPTMIFQTKIKFIEGQLEFQSAEFIRDEFPDKRDLPAIDSVIVNTNS